MWRRFIRFLRRWKNSNAHATPVVEAYDPNRKLRIKAVEIEGGREHEWVRDLQLPKQVIGVYLLFANGELEQVRFDAESEEGLEVLRGIARGPGACKLITDTHRYRDLPIWREGYRYFLQGDRNVILIAETPQPDLFLRVNESAPSA